MKIWYLWWVPGKRGAVVADANGRTPSGRLLSDQAKKGWRLTAKEAKEYEKTKKKNSAESS